MQLSFNGLVNNIEDDIIGVIKYDPIKLNILNIIDKPISDIEYKIICNIYDDINYDDNLPQFINKNMRNILNEGDIVHIKKGGKLDILFRIKSYNNSLFFTDRCNSNCLMCSQPPKNIDDIVYRFNLNIKLLSLIPKDTKEIGITGGEPTLYGKLFIDFLNEASKKLPNTLFHILSNGRLLNFEKFTKKISKANNNIIFGIPIYSDIPHHHDFIVQNENSFYQTLNGIYNLYKYNINIEIRIVLQLETIKRLPKLSNFIYKNLPFASHITFMGLEHIGYYKVNENKLSVNPLEYMSELQKSILFLSSKNLNVSIYNLPLCILPENLRKFARQSISDWKLEYLEICSTCNLKQNCPGMFRWNLDFYKLLINPIQSF
jgi:His-Xaa-Ser system radical SAM maturase HxsC